MKKTDQPSSFSEYVKKFDELKVVFDNLPEGVMAIFDSDMNIATANKAFSKILRIPLANILGQKVAKVLKNDIPDLVELLKETTANTLGPLSLPVGRLPVSDVRRPIRATHLPFGSSLTAPLACQYSRQLQAFTYVEHSILPNPSPG